MASNFERLTTFASLFLGMSGACLAGPVPPCSGDAYGSSADRVAIEDAMYTGTIQQAADAVNDGKDTRGDKVGCTVDTWSHATPNTTHPTLSQLESLWNTVHAPGLLGYSHNCAALGRGWPATALGALHAKLGGYSASATKIRVIADQVEASQYTVSHAPEPLVTYPGLYAYALDLANSASACYRGGTVASQIDAWCSAKSSVCPTYDSGDWTGKQFLVEDFSTNPREYGGAAAYDHGWDAAMMVEAWLQETDPVRKATYEQSARLAADWSDIEPSVRNHNYTAKNIWVLAQLYAITGEALYKAALEEKISRNLMPGILMDLDSNGLVDGMTSQLFSGLTLSAQTPGRMWDGHNANPWYQAMNAWAGVETYVAFRDRGDTALAADIRPYMIAMLDNLATELVNQGPPAPSGEHMWPLPYPLLTALWKVADYENEPHALWADAAATLYNWGLFNSFDATANNLSGRGTASLAMYLLVEAGVDYEPLADRLSAGAIASNPDPADVATDIAINSDLSWSAGSTATSHNVYFGTAPSPDTSEFQGNQAGATFDPGPLTYSTAYYWRIDELDGTTTHTGPVWSFTTEPAPGGPAVLLNDDFESNSFSTESWVTDWEITSESSVSGSLAALCTRSDSSLASRTLDTSSGSDLTVSFYYYDDDIDNSDDARLQFFNGAGYDDVVELGITSPEDTWHYYTITIGNTGSNATYFRSDFHIRIECSSVDFFENLGIDNVEVAVD